MFSSVRDCGPCWTGGKFRSLPRHPCKQDTKSHGVVFFAVATQLLKLARRKTEALLLFFCEVDNLKQINDSFSHQTGDLTLIRAAAALEQSFGDADVIARIGGDGFVVMNLEASSQVERLLLRRPERNLRKVGATERRYRLSLSVGVSRFDPKEPISLGTLMSQADKAMYEQRRKRSGSCVSQPDTGEPVECKQPPTDS